MILTIVNQVESDLDSYSYDSFFPSFIYLITSLFLVFLARLVFRFFHRGIDVGHELVEKDNLSFAIANIGYYIGALLCVGGVVIGESKGLLADILLMLLYGFGGIILLNFGQVINDKLILYRFNLRKEIIEDQNAGAGVVAAAGYIATGFIVMGTLMGEGGTVLTTLYIWLIGQAALILGALMYNLITSYDIHTELEKDNVAVGIGFAGAIIAIANLLFFSLQDDFVTLPEYLIDLAIFSGLGILALPIIRLIADRVLLPGQKLTDEIVNQEKPNVGAAFIEAFSYVGGSILITWCL